MKYWIFKTEPSTYSIDDLQREKTTEWSGIRNYQVRNMIRDEMSPGDRVLIYHSSAKEIGIAGEAKIKGKAYPDTLQFEKKSHYFDSKSKKENPAWMSRDITFVKKFKRTILLVELKEEKELEGMRLLQRGNRLSITQITEKEFMHILTLAK